MHFYIIFGTNLLTEGPMQIAVFCLFQCFEETEYQTESKRNETFGNVIFSPNVETWTLRQGIREVVTRVGGAPPASWAPCWPSGAHLLVYEVFRPKKNHKQISGRDSAATRRNLGGTNLGLSRSCSAGKLPSGRGKSSPSSSPTLLSSGEGNLHQHLHQHHLLSNPSSSLVSNLCPKASDWYLWVASSVDYSL